MTHTRFYFFRGFPLLCVLLLGKGSFAQTRISETKEFQWNFTLQPTDLVDVVDKYGFIKVIATEGRELRVSAVLETWGKTPEVAQKLQKAVSVRQTQTAGFYSFTTDITESLLIKQMGAGFMVRYTVAIPRGSRLRLQESYGKVELGDYAGELDIRVRYGSLRAGNLAGATTRLELGYSGGMVTHIEAGTIDLAYTSGIFEIETAGELGVKARYSKLRLNQVRVMDADAAYSELYLGSVDRFTGTLAYSELDLERLQETLRLTGRYLGECRLHEIASSFQRIDLEASYSDVVIGLPRSVSCDFDISLAYGDLDEFPFETAKFNYREEGEDEMLLYRGRLGSGSSRVLRTSLRYGDLRITPY